MDCSKSTSTDIASTPSKSNNKTFTANPAEIAKRLQRPSAPKSNMRVFVPPISSQPAAILFKAAAINALVSNKKTIPVVTNSA